MGHPRFNKSAIGHFSPRDRDLRRVVPGGSPPVLTYINGALRKSRSAVIPQALPAFAALGRGWRGARAERPKARRVRLLDANAPRRRSDDGVAVESAEPGDRCFRRERHQRLRPSRAAEETRSRALCFLIDAAIPLSPHAGREQG